MNSTPLVPIPLSKLGRGDAAEVSGLSPEAALGSEGGESLLARLRDLGFVAGARCEVVARMWGGNPMAVRVGGSTFALRRAEAAAVRVLRLCEQSRPSAALAAKDASAAVA